MASIDADAGNGFEKRLIRFEPFDNAIIRVKPGTTMTPFRNNANREWTIALSPLQELPGRTTPEPRFADPQNLPIYLSPSRRPVPWNASSAPMHSPPRSLLLSNFLASPNRSLASAATGPSRSASRASNITTESQIPTSYCHPTMALLTTFPTPEDEIAMGESAHLRSDEGIERLMTEFGLDKDTVLYDAEQTCHGKTIPGFDPTIGPAAFESRLIHPGNGPTTQLDESIIKFHVALTIAHELSHLNQLDTFPRIELAGREKDIADMEPMDSVRLKEADLHQLCIFETLAYQSELCNIGGYVRHHPNLSAGKQEQLQALRDVAVHQRDFFFFKLPNDIAESILGDDVEKALQDVRDKCGDYVHSFIKQPSATPVLHE